jgi:hypothetical protein
VARLISSISAAANEDQAEELGQARAPGLVSLAREAT